MSTRARCKHCSATLTLTLTLTRTLALTLTLTPSHPNQVEALHARQMGHASLLQQVSVQKIQP